MLKKIKTLFLLLGREGKDLPDSHYSVVPNWPAKDTASTLGQVQF
jgi:hypothetical protein